MRKIGRCFKRCSEKACAMNSRVGNTFGSGNKGKPKSEEHKKNIAANHKGGRKKKNIAPVTELV